MNVYFVLGTKIESHSLLECGECHRVMRDGSKIEWDPIYKFVHLSCRQQIADGRIRGAVARNDEGK